MKKMLSLLCVMSVIAVLTTSCDTSGTPQMAKVRINAGIADDLNRAVTGGTVLDTITSYRVVFSKVEIGNSEEDKFTLWENSGEEMDITGPVNFGDSAELLTGTYNYVRLTIGQIINVDGSIDDEGIVYTGTGSCQLDEINYLWGTNISNNLGEISLQGAIEVSGDCTLSFSFDIGETVSYEGGPAEAAGLSVIKPVLGLNIIEN